MERKRIKVSELEPNTGQIDGLPINPRQWTKTDVDKIAASLKETPELFEARPLIVTPHAGKYVILGGNLRFEGVKKNKDKDAPCVIVPEDTPIGKLKEIVVKDNGSFGAWDYDALANEWDDLPLADWGVPSWEGEGPAPDEFGEDFKLPDGAGPASNQITFYFAPEQKSFILDMVEEVAEGNDNFGNENKQGNKLYQVVKQWAEQRK